MVTSDVAGILGATGVLLGLLLLGLNWQVIRLFEGYPCDGENEAKAHGPPGSSTPIYRGIRKDK
jgi:hypothetical protein